MENLTENDIAGLRLEDILSIALESEIDAQQLYKKIKKINSDDTIRTIVDGLIDDEKSHEERIRSMFVDFFPEKNIEDVEVEKDFSGEIEIKDEHYGVNELLEEAIEKEKKSSEFYETMSEQVDKKAVSNLLSYLAYIENEHRSLLKRELSGRK